MASNVSPAHRFVNLFRCLPATDPYSGPMSNASGRGSGDVATLSAPTIERSKRCENCLLWDRSDAAIAHYKQKRFADIQYVAKEVLANDGKTTRRARDAQIARLGDDDSNMAQLGSNYEMGDSMIRQGMLGICTANNAEGDFVHAYYLCDKWQQRVKPDGDDGFHDELPEDARKRVYGDDA